MTRAPLGREEDLLAVIWAQVPTTRADVCVPVGDDAAVFVPAGNRQVITVDTISEGRHFRLDWSSYRQVGATAVEIAASDIVAMGARMQGIAIQLTLPASPEAMAMQELHSGIGAACNRLGLVVYGGNITTRPGPLELSVTVIGSLAQGEHPVCRGGARVGDDLICTGPLGGAAGALRMLTDGGQPSTMAARPLLEPRARIDLTEFLQRAATSAIDISDGLASELHHLAAASQLGFEFWWNMTPRADGATFAEVCFGGGDYEILATVPTQTELPPGVVRIGRVVQEPGVWCHLETSERISVPNRGFDHLLLANGSQ